MWSEVAGVHFYTVKHKQPWKYSYIAPVLQENTLGFVSRDSKNQEGKRVPLNPCEAYTLI